MESSKQNKAFNSGDSNQRGSGTDYRGGRGGGRGSSFRGNFKSGRGGGGREGRGRGDGRGGSSGRGGFGRGGFNNEKSTEQTPNIQKAPPAPSSSTTLQAQQKATTTLPFPQTLIQQHTEDRQVTYGYVSFRQKVLIKSSQRPAIKNSRVQARKEWAPYNNEDKAQVKLEKNNCFITNENQLAELDFIKQLVASSKIKKSEKELQGKLKEIEFQISGVKQDLKSGKVPQYYGRYKPRFNNRQQYGRDQRQFQQQPKKFNQPGEDYQKRVFGDDYTVRVTNLPDQTKEDQISESFEVFGPLKGVKVLGKQYYQEKQQFRKKKLGSTIAFVTFKNKESMDRALQQQHHVIGMLEVSISLPRPKRI